MISTLYLLAPAPHRTGLAECPDPALQTGSQVIFSDRRFSSVDNASLGSVPCIVSLPRYTCLSTPSLHQRYPASSVLWVDPTTCTSSSKPRSLGSKYPLTGGRHRSSQVPGKSLEQHAVDYDPGGVSAISPLTITSLLPSVFLITRACSTT